MMGFKELKEKLFPPYDGDDEFIGIGGDDEDFENEDDTRGEAVEAPARKKVSNDFGYDRGVGVASHSAIEMKVVTPTTFDSATQIANLLLQKKTVLLNLENTNKETAKRLIDFLSGVAFALNGYIKKVADNTFAVTPDNVEVSSEAVDHSAEVADEESEQY